MSTEHWVEALNSERLRFWGPKSPVLQKEKWRPEDLVGDLPALFSQRGHMLRLLRALLLLHEETKWLGARNFFGLFCWFELLLEKVFLFYFSDTLPVKRLLVIFEIVFCLATTWEPKDRLFEADRVRLTPAPVLRGPSRAPLPLTRLCHLEVTRWEVLGCPFFAKQLGFLQSKALLCCHFQCFTRCSCGHLF